MKRIAPKWMRIGALVRKVRGVWLLIGAVLLVAGIAALAVVMFSNSNKELTKTEDLARLGDEIVDKFCSDYDVDKLVPYGVKNIASRPSDHGSPEYWKFAFGHFVSGSGKIDNFAVGENAAGDQTPRAFYKCDAVFSKAEGTINMEFDQQPDSKWLLQAFDIDPR